MNTLLDLRGLTVELPTTLRSSGQAVGWVRPVNDVSLRLERGASLGLVGESGSGKTMLSLALMGLLPMGARVSGSAKFDSASGKNGGGNSVGETNSDGAVNLAALKEDEWTGIRGRRIAMVFQEPMTALNPVMRVGVQIAEAIRAHHRRMRSEEVGRRVVEALTRASVPEPELRARQYPHELSGGLRQRVLIAMAISAGENFGENKRDADRGENFKESGVDAKLEAGGSPFDYAQGKQTRPYEERSTDKGGGPPKGGPYEGGRLLIADEPTTALDVTVQKQILELLMGLRRELGLSLIFITHDLAVVAQVADRLAVMYAGRVVEEGPTMEVLRRPRHPYTEGLLRASPQLSRRELMAIPGMVPGLDALPPGCAFEPRCAVRRDECTLAVPEMRVAGEGHGARCVLV